MKPQPVGRYVIAAALILFGAGLLADNLAGTRIANLFWTYWPLLPLALGVELTVRSILSDRATRSGRSPIHFHVEPGVTIVTIVVVVLGLIGAMLGPTNWSLMLSDIHFIPARIQNSSTDVSRELAIGPEVKSVTITNPCGKTQVEAGTGGRISVEATITGNGSTTEQAKQNAEATKMEAVMNGSSAEVTVTLPEGEVTGINKYNLASVSLTVSIPKGLNVVVKNQFGEVDVATGVAVDVDNEFGKVTVYGSSGDITINNQFGEVTVEDATGMVTVSNANGAVTISGAKGDVSAKSSFGSVEVNDAAGKVEARTSNGSIRVDRPGKDVIARTSFGAIDITDAQGAVTADTSNGAITISTIHPVVGTYDLRTSFGGVNLTFPKSSKVTLHAETNFGGINTNLSGDGSKDNSRQTFDATLNGGGSRITVRTSNGGVNITGD